MNILEVKQAVLLCRQATFLDKVNKQYIIPWLWGHTGIGKSSAINQVCDFKRLGFIDFRCSQIEASDLRGLPDKQMNEDNEAIRTIFLPPSDMPVGHDEDEKCPGCDPDMNTDEFNEQYGGFKPAQPFYCSGILFLDELPRAEDDVIQAGFQLMTDGAIGSYVMPAKWSIVVAGNYLEGYQQNNFQDPAWLSRFSHIILSSGDDYKQEWFDYIVSRYNSSITNKVMQFVGFNSKHLMGDIKGDLGFSVQATPRTWEYAVRIMEASKQMPEIPKKVVNDLIAGLIGRELAISFDNFNIDVTPQEVVNQGVKANKAKLDTLTRNQLVGLSWGVVQLSREKKREISWMENVLDFMEWIAGSKSSLAQDSRDIAVSLGRQLYMTESNEYCEAMLSNPTLAKLAVKFNKGNPLNWISRVNMREELQSLMSRVAFGV